MTQEARAADFFSRIAPDVLYGTILLAAVLGSLSDPLPRNLTIIITIYLSIQAVSWAKSYSMIIRKDMERSGYTPWAVQLRALARPSWTMASAALPVAFFGLAMLGVIGQETALLATRVALVVVLASFGFIARRIGGAGLASSLWAGSSVALLGYVVIQIKLWAKYLPQIGV